MEDNKRETVLDSTYLQPGIVARAGAVGVAAIGIGAGVLLACWGASFFFNTSNKRLDALTAKVEELVQRPDRTDEVLAKLDNLNREAGKIGGNITTHLVSIEGGLEELKHRPIIAGNLSDHEKTVNGKVITKEVTVFREVPHDNGRVVTGWLYPDGASADQQPKYQFCYWTTEPLGGTTNRTSTSLAENGVRLPNIGPGVPRLEDALKECKWWNAASN